MNCSFCELDICICRPIRSWEEAEEIARQMGDPQAKPNPEDDMTAEEWDGCGPGQWVKGISGGPPL